MKYKNTFVATTEKALSVTISVVEGTDEDARTVEVCNVTFPFNLVPPQIAHQIASQLVMCNSYLVEDEKGRKPVSVSPVRR